jgi:hypothetical protein
MLICLRSGGILFANYALKTGMEGVATIENKSLAVLLYWVIYCAAWRFYHVAILPW